MISKQPGFSLLEVLLASALFAFVAMMTVRAFTIQNQKGVAEEAKTNGRAELTELRDRFSRSFRERLSFRAGDPATANPPFRTPVSATSPPGLVCSDLMVAVRVVQPGIPSRVEWVGYHTECGGTCLRIRRYAADALTQIAAPVTHPKQTALRSVAVCFQDQPPVLTGHITAAVTGVITVGNDSTPVTIQAVLPKQEASQGVELLPN